MEGEMNALIFPLHSRRQNRNTDEGGDAPRDVLTTSFGLLLKKPFLSEMTKC